jgi:hypothetical protein
MEEEREREKKGSVTTSVHIDQPQWLSTSSIQTNVRARRERESLRRQIKSDTADTHTQREGKKKKKKKETIKILLSPRLFSWSNLSKEMYVVCCLIKGERGQNAFFSAWVQKETEKEIYNIKIGVDEGVKWSKL